MVSIESANLETENEFIINAVGKLAAQIQSNPKAAIMEPSVRSELNEGLKATVSIRNFELTVDEPAVLGGTNKGPNPVELVLGALATCKEIVVKAYAVSLGIQVNSVKVHTSGKLDLKGFLNLDEQTRAGFNEVNYHIVIETPETDSAKLEQLRALTETKCPVHDIIQNPVDLNGSIQFANPN